jgi:hypothetical protein
MRVSPRNVLLVAALAVAGGPAAGQALAAPASPPASHPGQSTKASPNPSSNGRPQSTPPAGPKTATSGAAQGIVQSVSTASVVLAQLDGTTVTIGVTSSTRVFLNGTRASVADVQPGFVATARWRSGEAIVLQAFDVSPTGALQVGTVQSLSHNLVVAASNAGVTVRIHVAPRTLLLLDGAPAKLSAVSVGDTVVYPIVASAAGNKPARELRFLSPV